MVGSLWCSPTRCLPAWGECPLSAVVVLCSSLVASLIAYGVNVGYVLRISYTFYCLPISTLIVLYD